MLPPRTIGMQPIPMADTVRPWPRFLYFIDRSSVPPPERGVCLRREGARCPAGAQPCPQALLNSCAFLKQPVFPGGRLVFIESRALRDRGGGGDVHADIAKCAN